MFRRFVEIQHFQQGSRGIWERKFAVALSDGSIVLEAAHVQRHSHNGTDRISNRTALCSLHHLLFDRGTFHLSDALEV